MYPFVLQIVTISATSQLGHNILIKHSSIDGDDDTYDMKLLIPNRSKYLHKYSKVNVTYIRTEVPVLTLLYKDH